MKEYTFYFSSNGWEYTTDITIIAKEAHLEWEMSALVFDDPECYKKDEPEMNHGNCIVADGVKIVMSECGYLHGWKKL